MGSLARSVSQERSISQERSLSQRRSKSESHSKIRSLLRSMSQVRSLSQLRSKAESYSESRSRRRSVSQSKNRSQGASVVASQLVIALASQSKSKSRSKGGGEATSCGEAGTCAGCTNTYAMANDGCIGAKTLTRTTGCTWWWNSAEFAGISCNSSPEPDVWQLNTDDKSGGTCIFQKPIASCPAGTYTRTSDDCGCYATVDIT